MTPNKFVSHLVTLCINPNPLQIEIQPLSVSPFSLSCTSIDWQMVRFERGRQKGLSKGSLTDPSSKDTRSNGIILGYGIFALGLVLFGLSLLLMIN